MGYLRDGQWCDRWDYTRKDGSFDRWTTGFRNWITPDGSTGPGGDRGFAAEAGRYHLYVSYACPWAHRALIFRALKGLKDIVGVSVVHPEMLAEGWSFGTGFPGATGDRVAGQAHLRDVYLRVDPGMSGRVTVPVLWDTKEQTIVSNESAEIIRMFNSAFDGITGNTDDYAPEALRAQIETVNARIYDTVNNGVYKAGFATSQDAYDAAVGPLFDTFDWIEDRLSRQRYLVGARITEADWRLFTTLIRFDKVYECHFKCNRRRIVDYPQLWAYTRELYQWPGVAETVDFDHICRHYYYSHDMINPSRIIPVGPDLDLAAPHGRDALPVA
ncbi:glutathionyl-hydroquinone reductase YqjG [Salipiger aestuarii]|uniref:Putative glutathione S-transferase n=1 Tax=Salipiger aestuarii TaxID=568098 RepID=A0A327YVL8_9RHOB|nr:glutathione S-transferase family protein [Salipiger aestuarii]EIE49536.1 putative glutathione S-transferase [Citreicella sp. 357]KAA8610128.1 glutathionyl-hydroquinone reductase YqjG [Salipiger aestuarii]KAA8616065.1 glutathionyl-hydroquinone reductase YqjG [Salipiger aestuarii]KAB2543327.1 glutathionyl-hydroquinone reductase YqjG [Salipiger aestuarii]RAK24007.1 putative glutathione S-transferase [Salipiger aestuarii]